MTKLLLDTKKFTIIINSYKRIDGYRGFILNKKTDKTTVYCDNHYDWVTPSVVYEEFGKKLYKIAKKIK